MTVDLTSPRGSSSGKDPETGILAHDHFELIDKPTMSFLALPNHRFGLSVRVKSAPEYARNRHRITLQSGRAPKASGALTSSGSC
jgi:hypothetical protein